MNAPEWETCILKYVNYRARSWSEADRLTQTHSLLAILMAFSRNLNVLHLADLTPRVWFAYVQERIRACIKPSSLNTELKVIQSLLRFVKETDNPICETMLEVRPLKTGKGFT
ncbi:MAG: hypothetical protein IPG80_16465 [Anaerolineales bacterium]|uniref:hypothetical protein n=1 Tax=Candidatus Villigracilis vicinus TaxID=3140679 RepID=UPI003134D556|nr:hypothetical protein [Anaerolineales bacterium]